MLSTSSTISQPLADDALHGKARAQSIINAKRNTIAVAKIKFRKITMQVLFLAVLVHALHAALENRIVVFNGVRVNETVADIFASRMRNHTMRRKLLAHPSSGYFHAERCA